MSGMPINRADFSFKIQEKEGWCELQTSNRFINCDMYMQGNVVKCAKCGEAIGTGNPAKYRIYVPHFWELHPQEMAIALDVMFEELGKNGFAITGFGTRKPRELEIEATR